MALVHDDKVEEVRCELPVESRAPFVLGDGLVDGEVHLAALADPAVLDLPPRVPERREGLVLRVVYQNIPVRQVQYPRPSMLPRSVPAHVPELPADLERHQRLARSRSHRQQDASLLLQHSLHDAVDGDLLVVARALAGEMVRGRQQPLRCLLIQPLSAPQAAPQLLRRRERVQLTFQPGQVIELDDALSIGRVGELETQDLRVVLCLLKPGTRRLVRGLRLYHRDREVSRVLQEKVRPLLWSPSSLRASNHDPAVGKRSLLRNRAWRLVPPGLHKPGYDVLSASVGLVDDLDRLHRRHPHTKTNDTRHRCLLYD